MLNRFTGIGNLTKDPELKYTPKGTAVCEIGIAINRVYSTESGEKREDVTFLNITYFGKRGETLAKWTKKGKPLYVEARLQNESWNDSKTGEKRHKLALIGEDFQFIGGAKSDGGESQEEERPAPRQSAPPAKSYSAPPKPPADPDLDASDDIPW